MSEKKATSERRGTIAAEEAGDEAGQTGWQLRAGNSSGPLAGVRVIDLTAVIFGPLATQMLGDLGAEVIKIESPEGDMMRHVAPCRSEGMGALFLAVNRNKKSVVLDLKSDAGRAALLDLVKTADVFVSSIRPGALARLGLEPAALRALNSRLITVALTGFGTGGPYADRPAFDDTVQAAGGAAALASMIEPGTPPRYFPTILADKLAGVTAAHAILAALFHRERTGEAQHIEVPMLETLSAFLLTEHLSAATFEEQPKSFGYARILDPHRRPVPTKDGYLTLLPYTNAQWRRFFELAGRHEMIEHPWVNDLTLRSRHIGALYDMLVQMGPERTTAEWLEIAEQADIPAMKVNRLEDLPTDPHLSAVGLFQRLEHPTEGPIWTVAPAVRFSKTPARPDHLPPPPLGADTEAVLAELREGLEPEAGIGGQGEDGAKKG